MESHPTDLKEALGVTPLLHLIPKQELAPLIGTRAGITVPQPFKPETTASARVLRDAFNHDPQRYSKAILVLTDDFDTFDDSELHELTFKKPMAAQSDDKPTYEFPPLESTIFANTTDVPNSAFLEADLTLDPTEFDGSRLSVRKRYNPDEIDAHNHKYKSKFKKEWIQMGLTTKKHKILEPLESPTKKRIQKPTYISGNELHNRALNELQTIISDIETSQDEANDDHEYWTLKNDKKLLSINALRTISDSLLRIIKDPVVENIEVSQLSTIQQLCHSIIEESIHQNWNEVIETITTPESTRIFHFCTHVLASSKVILNILNGRIKDKKLFVEDYLISIVEFLSVLVQEFIVPIAAMSVDNIDLIGSLRPYFSILIPDVCSNFLLILEHMELFSVSDTIMTKLEFLLTHIILAEANRKEKTSLVGISSFETLRGSACQMILSIFKRLDAHRLFVIIEILTSFDKPPPQKTIARQYKLARGGNIQLITSLLVQFIQCFDPEKVSEYGGNSTTSKELLVTKATEAYKSSEHTSEHIAAELLSLLAKNPDQQHKQSLELLLEDLLMILPLPEWPGAELLVTAIMKGMLLAVHENVKGNSSETYMMELLGLIGEKILTLRISCPFNQLKSDEEKLQNCMKDTMEYLQLQINKSPSILPSMQFLALKYIVTGPIILGDELKSIDSLLNSISGGYFQLVQSMNYDKDQLSIVSYTNIVLSNEFPSLYEKFINMIMNSLESTKIKMKTRGLKILSSLIAKDPSLLIAPRVQESVSNRLLDTSPLVRDAVIDLISKYLISRPELVEVFYKPICDCIDDDSVQVRKRVTKLSKEMYLNISSRHARVNIAAKLLTRLEDEDDVIQELARSILIELWFTNMKTEVILDLIDLSKNKTFENFIAEQIIPLKETTLKASLSQIIDKILDSVDEDSDKIEGAMRLVSTFVKCNSTIINQDQLIALQPYLVDDMQHSMACYYTLEVLRFALPSVNSLRPDFFDFVQTYLLRNLTKFNIKELHLVLPSAWRLSEINESKGGELKNISVKLVNACVSCMNYVKPYIDKKKKHKEVGNDGKLIKLLHLIGCFGKYCRLESHRAVFLKSSLGMKEKESVTSVLIKYLLYFCDDNTEIHTRGAAIVNVIHICCTHPKLFLSAPILAVFDREFQSDNLVIIHSMINGIMEFLNKEETDSRRKNIGVKKSTRNTKLDVAVFHGNSKLYLNDGICAGLIQRYINRILQLCLYDSGSFSYLPVLFLQLVIKLGFANPKLCILTIIALESSTNKTLRSIANGLHQVLYERHESLTNTSYLEGIKLAVDYRIRVSTNLLLETGYLNVLYSIVRQNYSSKKKFVQSLSKIFNLALSDNLEANEKQRLIIEYISANIAAIPFGSLEEVLIIIHDIDKMISRVGPDLTDSIKKTPALISLCQTFNVITSLRDYLRAKYSIGQDRIEEFRPNKVDSELRQAPKTTNNILFPIQHIDLADETSIISTFTQSMEN